MNEDLKGITFEQLTIQAAHSLLTEAYFLKEHLQDRSYAAAHQVDTKIWRPLPRAYTPPVPEYYQRHVWSLTLGQVEERIHEIEDAVLPRPVLPEAPNVQEVP